MSHGLIVWEPQVNLELALLFLYITCNSSCVHIMMSHGLHESWQGWCRESFRIHGQLASADIGDSCYFLESADVGWSRRFFSDISLNSNSVTIRTYTADFIYLFLCTDTGVIATHALSFYWPLAPLSYWLMCSSLLWLRAAPYCTLLCTVTYCCSDAIVLVTPIVRVTLLFSYST